MTKSEKMAMSNSQEKIAEIQNNLDECLSMAKQLYKTVSDKAGSKRNGYTTKFRVGETVWTMVRGEPVKFQIIGISIGAKTVKLNLIDTTYYAANGLSRLEGQVFSSEQELAESMAKSMAKRVQGYKDV